MFLLRTFLVQSVALLLLALVSNPLLTDVLRRTNRTIPTNAPAGSSHSQGPEISKVNQAKPIYGKLPIYFEANVGQTDPQVKFIARGSGVTTFLTATEAVFSLPIGDLRLPIEEPGSDDPVTSRLHLGLRTAHLGVWPSDSRSFHRDFHKVQSPIGNRQSAIAMRLVGANRNPNIEGLDRLPGISNYFIGNDPSKWQTNIPHYAKIRYREVYSGIDLEYYDNEHNLEYDLVVKPGADPRRIELEFAGADAMQLDASGDLVVEVAGRVLRLCSPSIYQVVGSPTAEARTNVAGRYVIKDSHRVGFELSSYDVARALTIDPVIVYSSFLGGNSGESGSGIAVDSSGNAFVTGYSYSADLPTTPGALQAQNAGQFDAFVAKVNQKGDALLFLTYLGGSSSDYSRGIALDSAGNAYLTGSTESNNFPVTSNAYQRTQSGGDCGRGNPCSDAFIVKLNPDGNTLLYSTYLGGDSNDYAHALTVQATGHVTVAGLTSARAGATRPFPVTAGAYQTTIRGDFDGFVTRLDLNGSSLVFSTLFGGTGQDILIALATDSAGNSYVTGWTWSRDLPVTPGVIQSTHGGGGDFEFDAFVAKLTSNGTGLVYSTYLGGYQWDMGQSIVVDSLGNAYVGGGTRSPNFQVSTNALQKQLLGGFDGFVSKLNPSGTSLVFSTLLGGSDPFDPIATIALDPAGRIVVAGRSSIDFPLQTTVPFSQYTGGFVALLSGAGDRLLSSIFLGGGFFSEDGIIATGPMGIAVDASGDVYVTGTNPGVYFPTVYPFQPRPGLAGDAFSGDAFVAKISFSADRAERLFVPIVLSSSGANGSYFTSELTVANRTSQDARLEFTYTAAIGSGSGTASDRLLAGEQKIVPDALQYLRTLGIPIPESGNQGGTLSVAVSGAPAAQIGVVVRTTTSTGNGRAGLAYGGVSLSHALWGPAYLVGLRQDAQDRTNIAIQNMGEVSDGEVTLRINVFGTKPPGSGPLALPDIRLSPGEFRQINSILTSSGLALQEGFVRVERVTGRAPYYAYAVINDQVTSDGSFVVPIRAEAFATGWPPGNNLGQPFPVVPAVVESGLYESELILTNTSNSFRNLALRNISDAIQPAGQEATVEVPLQPGEQRIIRNYVQWLRDSQPLNTTIGSPYAGVLRITQANDPNYGLSGVFAAARVSTRTGNRFGVFYPASSSWSFTYREAWLYGLQQNSTTRSNLALVSLWGDTPYKIELFDGTTGSKVATVDSITSAPWLQLNEILAQYAPGVTQAYARVSRREGYNAFITYAVINDGGAPGERTGDGAFIASSP